jgi:hypothetical protein
MMNCKFVITQHGDKLRITPPAPDHVKQHVLENREMYEKELIHKDEFVLIANVPTPEGEARLKAASDVQRDAYVGMLLSLLEDEPHLLQLDDTKLAARIAQTFNSAPAGTLMRDVRQIVGANRRARKPPVILKKSAV